MGITCVIEWENFSLFSPIHKRCVWFFLGALAPVLTGNTSIYFLFASIQNKIDAELRVCFVIVSDLHYLNQWDINAEETAHANASHRENCICNRLNLLFILWAMEQFNPLKIANRIMANENIHFHQIIIIRTRTNDEWMNQWLCCRHHHHRRHCRCCRHCDEFDIAPECVWDVHQGN